MTRMEMNRMGAIFLLTLVCLASLFLFNRGGGSGSSPPRASWALTGSAGDTDFVLMDGTLEYDDFLFNQASGRCSGEQACEILFWDDEANVATALPLTAAQEKGLVARWKNGAAFADGKFQWNCSLFPEADPADCL